ncbi:hypothetical protein BZY99_10775 [Pectobacterium versatile]|nr:hypothetical protein BZY99_10775 [Pectobacterium versatile]
MLLKTRVKTDYCKQKSLPMGRLKRYFSFLFLRAKPLNSGAKVKKETENSSVHTCVTFVL